MQVDGAAAAAAAPPATGRRRAVSSRRAVSRRSAAAVDASPAFDWTPYAYAVPALALLLVTLLALLRLFALRGRAQVLVDPIWLSALAHAQRRMGFKNGTALLTSDELQLADQLGPDAPGDPAQRRGARARRAKPRRSSPTNWRTSRGSTGPS